jgi:hypothetical protein
MDLRADISALTDLDGRAAGTDAERRGACHVRDRLQAVGRQADLEPIAVRQRWALAQAVATAAAVVGSVISVSRPGLGLALVLLAALSSILEATGSAHVVRRLTGTRASQNVSSLEHRDGKRGALVLAAHCDAPREAAFGRFARRAGDPWAVIGGSLLLVLAFCVLRLLGFEGDGLTALQLLPTLLLLAVTPLLVDVELSPAGRGEPDAAAAAAVISLAEELEGELRYLDLWVVVTGGRVPFGQGMRAWLRRHRGELDPRRTVVVAIEALGCGGVRYTTREGPRLLSWRSSTDVIRLCREIAGDDEDGAAFGAEPVKSRESGDAVAALSRGVPAIGIATARREPVDPAAVERARDFCAELARRIDVELAPRVEEEPLRPA